ncbi:MAG: hypothetical protein HY254_01915 [Burkholderiales bacterium]|nr:hypothetical protein [Burkholderiales bacterium]
MYEDKKCIKTNRVCVRFDDYEMQIIKAMAAYQGEQPAAFLRALIMREAEAVHPQKRQQMLAAK